MTRHKADAGFEPIPVEAEAVLDPAWIHTAFDLAPDVRVLEASSVDAIKTVADKLRFRVEFETGEGERRSLYCCAKAHFGEAGQGSLVTEAHVYRDLLPNVAVRVPRTHYIAVDDDAGRAIIVMEDLEAQGARFLNAHEPYEVALARETLSQLALLHASTWNDTRWTRYEWLAPRLGMVEWFAEESLQSLLDDGRSPHVPEPLRTATNLIAALENTAAIPGTCVIHGDTHSGNSYLDAQGVPHWLDWQFRQWGNWSLDVSYHLGTVLTVEDRRAHERELIDHYLEQLRSHRSSGDQLPSSAEGYDSYAAGFAWGWFLWTITTISSRAVVLEHIPRITTAMTDHDTLARLGAC